MLTGIVSSYLMTNIDRVAVKLPAVNRWKCTPLATLFAQKVKEYLPAEGETGRLREGEKKRAAVNELRASSEPREMTPQSSDRSTPHLPGLLRRR